MSNDPKSTNDVRLIAQDVARQQAQVCDVKRENLEQQLQALAETVKANAEAIASLTTTTTLVSATVTPLAVQVRNHGSSIEKLKGRPAVWAAIGAALPTLLGVLLWWFSK
jgi:hypothetical protein